MFGVGSFLGDSVAGDACFFRRGLDRALRRASLRRLFCFLLFARRFANGIPLQDIHRYQCARSAPAWLLSGIGLPCNARRAGVHLGARMEALGRFLVPDRSRALGIVVHARPRDGQRRLASQAS